MKKILISLFLGIICCMYSAQASAQAQPVFVVSRVDSLKNQQEGDLQANVVALGKFLPWALCNITVPDTLLATNPGEERLHILYQQYFITVTPTYVSNIQSFCKSVGNRTVVMETGKLMPDIRENFGGEEAIIYDTKEKRTLRIPKEKLPQILIGYYTSGKYGASLFGLDLSDEE